nr:PREDICTED: uncharacterized protein LOC108204047 [Daucus carota subsp. sativus]
MAIIEENTSNNEREENFEDEYRSITLEASQPLYLHPSDHPGLNLVTVVLNGDNFTEWKRSVTLALSAKNKLGFVNGRFKIPDESSLYFDHWQRCNDMIISWLLNVVIPEIRSSLMYTSLAVDVWNDIHTRYTQRNGPRIFELRKALSDLNQEALSVSAYYTRFKVLWDDFLNATSIPKCSCCSSTCTTRI